MTTTEITKSMPVRPFYVDHGPIKSSTKRFETWHCPVCFRRVHTGVKQCKCGQTILSK